MAGPGWVLILHRDQAEADHAHLRLTQRACLSVAKASLNSIDHPAMDAEFSRNHRLRPFICKDEGGLLIG